MSDNTKPDTDAASWLALREERDRLATTLENLRALKLGEQVDAARAETRAVRAERDRVAAMLADLVGAIEGRGQCWEHADACCREWCSRCQAEVEGDERLDAALARAKEER